VADDRERAWSRAVAYVERQSSGPPLDRTLRVTVHVHPDRVLDGRTVVEHLADEGVYRSQFETGTSNGGLTAYPGGDRWRWESRIFGGAYDDGPAGDRPTYGALNHRRRSFGGSVRFGSAHLRLAGDTLDRTTFCYPDSVLHPTDFGTATRMSLTALADADSTADTGTDRHDPLDDYVEAHLHGRLDLARDVEALVLDPAYRGSATEELARSLPVALEWHGGFRLSVTELERQADYRGPEIVAAGRSVAADGHLDAQIIGAAARRGTHDAQVLKRLWHCVARFGDLESR
jgi:hypothetical protein